MARRVLPAGLAVLALLFAAWMLLRGEQGSREPSAGTWGAGAGSLREPETPGSRSASGPRRIGSTRGGGQPSAAAAPSFAGAALRVMARKAVSGEPVETAVAGLHLEGAGRWAAFAREGGAIRFDALPAAAGTVTVSSPGFVDGSASVELVEGIEVVVDVDMHPVPTIAGRVVSAATGRPVAGAEVRASDRGPPLTGEAGPPAARTGPDGAFAFALGSPGREVHLLVGAAGFTEGRDSLRLPAAGVEPKQEEIRLLPSGLLRGVVLDADGEPAPGAVVEVRPVGKVRNWTGIVGTMSGLHVMEEPGMESTATAAADGTFAVEGLAAGGLYLLEASTRSPGAWGTVERVLVPEDGMGGRVEVRLGPGGRLVMEVAFAGGLKPTPPRLSVWGSGGHGWGLIEEFGRAEGEVEFFQPEDLATGDFEGIHDGAEKSAPPPPAPEAPPTQEEFGPWELEVPPGTYSLKARAGGIRRSAVAVVRSGEKVAVKVTLAPELEGAAITGTVVDDRGSPCDGVLVTAVPLAGTPAAGNIPVSRGGNFGWTTDPLEGLEEAGDSAWTSDEGTFRLEGLKAGERWRVAVVRGGSRVETVAPAEGILLTLERPAFLRGRAVMARGRIGEGPLTVRAEAAGREGRWEKVSAEPEGTGEGAFEIPGVAPGPVRFWLQRGAFVGGPVEITLAPGEDKDVGDVLLRPGAPMAGRLVDTGGRAVAGARMNLGSEWQETSRCVTGADGSFLLGVRPPLPWPVEVTGDACVPTVLTVDPAAPAPLRLVVPRGGLLRGRARDGAGLPAAGAVVEAAPAGGGEARRLPVDHLGRFEARLPEEVYQLMIQWEGAAIPAGGVRLTEGGTSDLALTVR